MNLVLDLIETLPKAPLLIAAGVGAVVPLPLAWLTGGTAGVVILLIGVAVVGVAGGLLALRVHLDRLPLVLAPVAAEGRIDGHRSLRFRVRLGRGRHMSSVRGLVRFVPTQGEPVQLPLLVEQESEVIGPWTLVVVDRASQIADRSGRFEVEILATEGSREWSARRSYGEDLVVVGRFLPAIFLSKGRIKLDHDRWGKVEQT